MQRRHSMPFGATPESEGVTRFRLFAPGAAEIDLELVTGPGHGHYPMEHDGRGWFELARQADAPAGTHYAFRTAARLRVPDPASRWNPDGVHGPSVVVDPAAYEWHDDGWDGRPWEDAVVYELHVGTFTPEGTFAAIAERLDALVALGVTALELMPIAAFAGFRNWGYDGVLPYAPAAAYGPPDALKRLVDAAHARGLMMLLDVVYNHFGPEGNYLSAYAPDFFDPRHRTPWGAAINYSGKHSRGVRDFAIHNALYWIEEFHFDGLRLDAIDAIGDSSRVDLVTELAQAVRDGPGAARHVHLIVENDRNESRYLARRANGAPMLATAQWNDDVHHALHVALTGESDGYYADFADHPLRHLGRALAEGFAWQGETSEFRHGRPRGEPSGHLPPTAFVSYLQTHDQVGNRASGERLAALVPAGALRAATAVVLLSPAIPLVFMGEEFAASAPFLFFCDFADDLAAAVLEGRRAEFARFKQFTSIADALPDPSATATFERSKLDWNEREQPKHDAWLAHYRALLDLRRREIVPRLRGMHRGGAFALAGTSGLAVEWTLGDGARLALGANLGPEVSLVPAMRNGGRLLYATTGLERAMVSWPAWTVAWTLDSNP
jgi:maltooligosyltrehalose trehalohydrolase